MLRGRALLPATLFAAAAVMLACGAPTITDTSGNYVGGTPRQDTPTPVPSGTNGKHHPDNFGDPTIHGPYALFQNEQCITPACHGAQLEGAAGPGCDTCHAAGWRTNCTYCHGGTDNQTGAPPRDITQDSTKANLVFWAHTAHVANGTAHNAYDCTQCHMKPTNALDQYHWFDDSPGKAEVNFTNGLGAGTAWDGTTCSTNYCHGNGRGNNGSISMKSAPLACDGCHPFQNSGGTKWSTMSGRHAYHLNRGYKCYECHSGTLDTNNAIADMTLHLNGTKDNKFGATNVTYNANNKTCNGTCHGKNHQGEGW